VSWVAKHSTARDIGASRHRCRACELLPRMPRPCRFLVSWSDKRRRSWLTAGLLLGARQSAAQSLAQSGALGGTVYRDAANHPLAGAEISIGALDRRAVSNAVGDFRLAGIAAGRYVVTIRHIGFKPLNDTVTIATNALVERDYELAAAAVQLDSVRVFAATRSRAAPRFAEFLERKRTNTGGHFIDEEQLRRHDARKLQDVITSYVPGIRRFRPLPVSRPTFEYLSSGRNGCNGPAFSCHADQTPCPVSLYVDGILVFNPSANRTDASNYPDMDRYVTSEYAGVEYYGGGASVPAQYNATTGDCGVLLLWTRRAIRP
jgi:hypothetical protein